jgi:hypothetical protein
MSILDHVVTVGDALFFVVGWVITKAVFATARASR